MGDTRDYQKAAAENTLRLWKHFMGWGWAQGKKELHRQRRGDTLFVESAEGEPYAFSSLEFPSPTATPPSPQSVKADPWKPPCGSPEEGTQTACRP